MKRTVLAQSSGSLCAYEGLVLRGRVHDVRHLWTEVPEGVAHEVGDFEGDRMSLVLHSRLPVGCVDTSVVRELESCGFAVGADVEAAAAVPDERADCHRSMPGDRQSRGRSSEEDGGGRGHSFGDSGACHGPSAEQPSLGGQCR